MISRTNISLEALRDAEKRESRRKQALVSLLLLSEKRLNRSLKLILKGV